jgi:asparagine synthase (glutamine-hydrolysing)
MLDNMTRWKMNYWMRSGNKTTFGIPIEPRTPFLDYRIVEFAFSLPPEYLIHDGWLKWILRVASSNALPSQVVWRKRKMGFPFPLKNWLLQSKVIVEKNLGTVECPYINSKKLMDAYDDLAHRASQHLWRLISLALWWRKFVENKPIVERKCKDHSDRSTA